VGEENFFNLVGGGGGGGGINLVVCKIRYFVCCKRIVQFVFQMTFTMYVRVSALLPPQLTFIWIKKMSSYAYWTMHHLDI